jgi:hypothetical protein
MLSPNTMSGVCPLRAGIRRSELSRQYIRELYRRYANRQAEILMRIAPEFGFTQVGYLPTIMSARSARHADRVRERIAKMSAPSSTNDIWIYAPSSSATGQVVDVRSPNDFETSIKELTPSWRVCQSPWHETRALTTSATCHLGSASTS